MPKRQGLGGIVRQIKIYAYALVVALCGIVFGLVGVVLVFLLFGHMTKAFFANIHLREDVFIVGMVVIGFAWGWVIGYRQAVKRIPN